MIRRVRRHLVLAGALCLAVATPFVLGPAGPAHAQESLTVQVTLYGWPDNSPPGADISCPQIHDRAGGTGTFDDPVTFATGSDQDGVMPCGTVIYVPYLKKYFIREDLCAGCRGPWTDLWAGGDQNSTQGVLACEDALTRSGVTITVRPDAGLPVDTTPIFDPRTGACYQP